MSARRDVRPFPHDGRIRHCVALKPAVSKVPNPTEQSTIDVNGPSASTTSSSGGDGRSVSVQGQMAPDYAPSINRLR